MYDDLALFVRIVDSGSLAATAQSLAMPAATLTRRLQKLEAQLGCRLLHRSARRLLPTAEGWAYYHRCQPLLIELQAATDALADELERAAGTVRLLAPAPLAGGALRGAWPAFMHAYPDIRLELRLAYEREDLLGQGADLALRVGEQPDASFGQRLLGWGHMALVAAPAYLASQGWPQTPHDLARHALLVAEPHGEWLLTPAAGGEQVAFLPRQHRLRMAVNDAQLAVQMAIAGHGVLFCPQVSAAAALADGRLQNPLPGWRGPSRPIYAIWPTLTAMPARVRVLLDFLVDYAARHGISQAIDPVA